MTSPEYLPRSHGVSPQTYDGGASWDAPAAGAGSSPAEDGPGATIKYEESLRHSLSQHPHQQQQNQQQQQQHQHNNMYAGSTRISGQQERIVPSNSTSSSRYPTPKSEEWSFPHQDFVLPSNAAPYSPPSHNNGSAGAGPTTPQLPFLPVSTQQRSPQAGAGVERPPRKRGKLPKETTDYLKAWLHRHSDHPYPSEEEKKQLCLATGLSMSQVSNWMINVRLVLSYHFLMF